MAITIVSGNLNIWGNNGQFETDPSTWGFSGFGTRSNEQKSAGLYSAKFVSGVDAWEFLATGYMLAKAGFAAPLVNGKKYIARAKVRSKTGSPPASAVSQFYINIAGQASINSIKKTVPESDGAWVTIEDRWIHDTSAIDVFSLGFQVRLGGDYFAGAQRITGGVCYVDQFEIYEYVGDGDAEYPDPVPPEPEPETFDQVFFSKNPIAITKAAPAGWDELLNFRLYSDVRVQDVQGSGEYISKLKSELYPDDDGNATFYLRQCFPFPDVLQAIAPAYNTSVITRLTDRIKFFKNYTGQLTGVQVAPDEEDIVESSRMLVLLGGINKQKFPGLNFFNEYLPTNKKFLSWAPVEKIVDRLQEDYLNFFVYDADTTTVKLQIKAYYDDATTVTEVVSTLTPVLYGYLLQIPTGPYNSGVKDIDPSKNLSKYEVTLLDQDDEIISEVRTYIVASVRHPLTRFIMFLNSLGSYEVIMFTGQAEFKTDYEREVIQKFLPHNYAAFDGEFAVRNVSLQEKVNYSTGYFTGRYALAWQRYMKDVLLSNSVYDVTSATRIPVSITSGTLDGGLDQDYVRFARIDTQKAYVDDCYTPDDL